MSDTVIEAMIYNSLFSVKSHQQALKKTCIQTLIFLILQLLESDTKVSFRDKNVCKCFVKSLPRCTMYLFSKCSIKTNTCIAINHDD